LLTPLIPIDIDLSSITFNLGLGMVLFGSVYLSYLLYKRKKEKNENKDTS